ncbi:MAG: histidine kinase dimerization/phosphoacceptor domain -containing protein [Crocinitomicaceae bacterium]
MIKYYLFISIFFQSMFGWAASSPVDSLIGKTDEEKMSVYNLMCVEFTKNSNDSVYLIGDLILQLDLPNDQQIVHYYVFTYYYEMRNVSIEQATETLEEGLSLRSKYPNANFDRLILGKVQLLKDKFQFYEAANILKEVMLPLERKFKKGPFQDEDLEKYSLCLNIMSSIYSTTQNYDRALKFDLKADSLALNNPLHLVLIKLNIADNYKQLGQMKMALKYSLEAMEIARKDYHSMYSWTCAKVAEAYNQVNELSNAVQYIDLAKDPNRDTNTFAGYPSDEIGLIEGSIRLRQGLYDEAIKACLPVYISASEKRNFSDIDKSCGCISQGYEMKGDLSKSLKFAQFQIQARDSIQEQFKEIQHRSLEASELITQNSFQLKLEQKEQELIVQKQQEKLESNKSKVFILFLVLSLLVLLLIGLLLYLRIRRRRELENEQSLKEKEVLLQEIHHRVKNNFQLMLSIVNLEVYELEDPKQITTLREIQNRITAMSIVHQLVYSESDFSSVSMQDYFHQLISQLSSHFFNKREMLNYQIDANSLSCTLEQTITVGLLSNELLVNSFKFGRSADDTCTVHVTMVQKEDLFELKIKDGRVETFVKVEKSMPLELELVNILTEQLDGTLALDDSNGREVTVTFPVQKKRALKEL